jgi:catechol 2,3-dioxygenase-like lactoylglutathione lyase family enzyme
VLDGARIFHVNVNCRDLARSRSFYVEGCGLSEGVRTTPEEVQSGVAFGLDRARWDAWILVGASGFDGGAVDLLEWVTPSPTGEPPTDPREPGARAIGLVVPDLEVAATRAVEHGAAVEPGSRSSDRQALSLRDPDGVLVTLASGEACRLVWVAVTVSELARSLAFYEELGFRPAVPGPVAVPPGAVVLDSPSPGEVQLVLVPTEGPPVAPGAPRPANAVGIWRTALLLSGLDVVVASLGVAGVELLSPVQSMAMGPGLPDLRFVCFRGPDGEVLELIEQP